MRYTMEKRNDALYLELFDYINGYTPSIDLTDYKVDKFLAEFHISNEETSISGTKSDWITFLVLVIERYSNLHPYIEEDE